MSDDDLIRRGDAREILEDGGFLERNLDRIAALPAVTVPDLSDPVVVHLNMLRGTIAKPTVEQIIHLYGVDALTAALPARGVTVKPLVWSQNSGGVWEAQTAFGTRYSVADSQWTYGPTMVWFWVDGGDEAAKAAAQADYEARGRAMWEPQPTPDAAAIREAALEKEVLRLKAKLWAIGHAAGIETKEDLMQAALDALRAGGDA